MIHQEEVPALEAVAGLAVVAAFVALGALLWSTAWIYGHEQPDD